MLSLYLASLQLYGVKGPSWLSTVPNFDLVQGVAVDYMHCVLLGVTRLLLRLWFTSSHHKEPWYIGRHVVEVDKRLCAIRPPDEILRTPRSVEKTVKYWKGQCVCMYMYVLLMALFVTFLAAHELQAWLLHYSPAVLHHILPEEYYQHYLLLVEGVYLLLKDTVKEGDIKQSSRLLKHYCILFPSYYGTTSSVAL